MISGWKINVLRPASLVAILLVLASNNSVAQSGGGQSESSCDQLQQLLDQYKAAHDACLAANSSGPTVTESSETCSHPACQQYHSYVYGSKGQALTAQIAACRHAEQFAQAAADQQKQADADRISTYGNAAVDANALTDQYNNQASAFQPYAMSDDTAQDIDAMHNSATSLGTSSDYNPSPSINDAVVDANTYAPSPDPDQDLSDFDRAAAHEIVDQGIQNIVGKNNYEAYKDVREVYKDVNDIRSDDLQKNVDGTFDLAEKWNDENNPNPISRYVNEIALPKLHNIYYNAAGLLNATMHAGSCITSSDSSCSDASNQLERQWNQFQTRPFGKPINDPSDIFGP